MRKFYDSLDRSIAKALFLIYATSGLRKREILSLTEDDIDWERRMITPRNHSGTTKRSWVSFFNKEAEAALREYLATRGDDKPKLFRISDHTFVRIWKEAYERPGGASIQTRHKGGRYSKTEAEGVNRLNNSLSAPRRFTKIRLRKKKRNAMPLVDQRCLNLSPTCKVCLKAHRASVKPSFPGPDQSNSDKWKKYRKINEYLQHCIVYIHFRYMSSLEIRYIKSYDILKTLYTGKT